MKRINITELILINNLFNFFDERNEEDEYSHDDTINVFMKNKKNDNFFGDLVEDLL